MQNFLKKFVSNCSLFRTNLFKSQRKIYRKFLIINSDFFLVNLRGYLILSKPIPSLVWPQNYSMPSKCKSLYEELFHKIYQIKKFIAGIIYKIAEPRRRLAPSVNRRAANKFSSTRTERKSKSVCSASKQPRESGRFA